MVTTKHLLQCVFIIGILIQSSVYLWKKRVELAPRHQKTGHSSKNKVTDEIKIDQLLDSSVDCASGETKPVLGIEPFPKFQLSAGNIDEDSDIFQTQDWWNLWNGDSNCTRHQVHLLKTGSEPEPGAFVSFPGSGNSWTRSLLMGITGVYVHSVYDEANFYGPEANKSSKIPVECGCSLLQKTHDFSLALHMVPREDLNVTLNKFKGRGILLIRNPFKSIQSYFNFIYGGMKGTAPISEFEGEEWDTFVSQSVASWETLNSVWIRGLKRGGVIYYERLRHETRLELLRLVTMLGFNYDSDRLDCVLRHSNDNSFKRNTDSQNVLANPYTASQRLLIHKAIESVQLVLKERGLDPLPVHYYDLFDNIPEYGLHTPQ